MSANDPDNVREAEREVADMVGRLMHFWGFKRPMGRMWTLLYLSPEAIGAAELTERLKMSAGSVSMTLAELVKWGAVKKTWRPGERRDFYEAETSIWKMVRRVLRDRELTLVREFGETLDRVSETLGTSVNQADAQFKRERVQRLRELAKLGEELLSALVAGETIDPRPLLKASSKS